MGFASLNPSYEFYEFVHLRRDRCLTIIGLQDVFRSACRAT